MPTVKEQLDAVQLEIEQLNLEKLRHDVATLRAVKEKAVFNHAQVETDLADARNRQKSRQDFCNHRKGGMGMDGLNGRGIDHNYAVARHRLPLGEVLILCMRCQKEWKPGTPGYEKALDFPTDNTMTESSQFRTETR